ncbi:MAG TPA: YggT family protein [Candidatus Saccharimonadales bacterium]
MSIMLRRLVDWIMMFVAAIISLRFILRLFDANADNGFVDWIYQTSGEILSPFRNIFQSAVLDGGFVIDFTALFGLVVYGLAGLLAVKLIDAWTPRHK